MIANYCHKLTAVVDAAGIAIAVVAAAIAAHGGAATAAAEVAAVVAVIAAVGLYVEIEHLVAASCATHATFITSAMDTRTLLRDLAQCKKLASGNIFGLYSIKGGAKPGRISNVSLSSSLCTLARQHFPEHPFTSIYVAELPQHRSFMLHSIRAMLSRSLGPCMLSAIGANRGPPVCIFGRGFLDVQCPSVVFTDMRIPVGFLPSQHGGIYVTVYYTDKLIHELQGSDMYDNLLNVGFVLPQGTWRPQAPCALRGSEARASLEKQMKSVDMQDSQIRNAYACMNVRVYVWGGGRLRPSSGT